MADADVLYLTVGELGKLLREGKTTSKDLTVSYIARIKEIDPKLNSFVTITEELAIQQADRADREIQGGSYLGPLHGISDPLGALGNLVGLPCVSVPCGFSNGLPIGMLVLGGYGKEDDVLSVGMDYQKSTDWHRRKPL